MEDATRERMGFGKTLASIGAASKKRRISSRRRHQLLSLQDQTLGGGKHELPAKEGDQPRSREPASPGEGRGEVLPAYFQFVFSVFEIFVKFFSFLGAT